MYGLNAVALVFFGCINVLVHRVCAYPEPKRRKTVAVLCAVFLFANLIRYGFVYPVLLKTVVLPVEFSTVAYFAVPIILLISRERLHSWAAYSGLMAGFFYYMTMILAGGPIYHRYPPEEVYLSLLCHGVVYFCGCVTLKTEALCSADRGKLAVGVALGAVNAAVLRPFVSESGGYLIYILLDAAVVRQLLPQSIWALALPVYYCAVSALVLLTIRGFFRTNRTQYQRRLRLCVAKA